MTTNQYAAGLTAPDHATRAATLARVKRDIEGRHDAWLAEQRAERERRGKQRDEAIAFAEKQAAATAAEVESKLADDMLRELTAHAELARAGQDRKALTDFGEAWRTLAARCMAELGADPGPHVLVLAVAGAVAPALRHVVAHPDLLVLEPESVGSVAYRAPALADSLTRCGPAVIQRDLAELERVLETVASQSFRQPDVVRFEALRAKVTARSALAASMALDRALKDAAMAAAAGGRPFRPMVWDGAKGGFVPDPQRANEVGIVT